MKGTTPRGAASEREASEWVRDMFARVAPRYDLANHLLSFHIDHLWRARTVARTRHILAKPGSRALDLCCGTGDLTLALARESASPVMGCDFCHPMLAAAREKAASRRAAAFLFEADALGLPLPDASLDLVTVAFGFRNLANYAAGLREMHRVLRPGGTAAILEFSRPPNPLFRALYNFYSNRILPLIGGALSGSRDAYTYLPESVRKFPSAPELAKAMRSAGFSAARFELFTGGIVALHLGEK
jgi:demethylmenaquinone methyltransferase / 2-methoxy-6-polyprenyl-1,4-benzoquinol methylase